MEKQRFGMLMKVNVFIHLEIQQLDQKKVLQVFQSVQMVKQLQLVL